MTACSRPPVNERSSPSRTAVDAVALRQPLGRDDDRAGRRSRLGELGRRRDDPGCGSPAGRDDDRAVLEAGDGLRRDPRAQQELLGQPQPAAAADDDRVALVVVARPLLRDAPVSDAHDPVGDPRRLRVVADDHGRAAMLPHELREHVVHLVGGRAVELAGRLVGEEDLRPVSERGAERDALLLAARELGRVARRASLRGRPARAARRPAAGARAARCRAGRAAARRARARSARARAHARSAGRRSRGASSGTSTRRRAGSLPRSSPCTRTTPADGRSSPASSRSSVDLPEPLGPSTVSTSPSRDGQRQPLQRCRVALGRRVDAEDVLQLDRVHAAASEARAGDAPRVVVARATSSAASAT